MLGDSPLKEMQKRCVVKRLSIDKLRPSVRRSRGRHDDTATNLVDAAHAETKGTTLDTGAVHVITNEQD